MVSINLLPWREYVQIYQQEKTKKILLWSIMLTFLALLIIYTSMIWAEKKINKEITHLNMEIQKFSHIKKLINQQNLKNNRNKLIGELYHYQRTTRKLFSILETNIPDDICFTDIIRKNNSIIFIGRANTAFQLTELLKNWQAAPLFSEIKIDKIQYQTETHDMHFRFFALENETSVSESLYVPSI